MLNKVDVLNLISEQDTRKPMALLYTTSAQMV